MKPTDSAEVWKPAGATIAVTRAWPLRSAVTTALPESGRGLASGLTRRMEASLVLQVMAGLLERPLGTQAEMVSTSVTVRARRITVVSMAMRTLSMCTARWTWAVANPGRTTVAITFAAPRPRATSSAVAGPSPVGSGDTPSTLGSLLVNVMLVPIERGIVTSTMALSVTVSVSGHGVPSSRGAMGTPRVVRRRSAGSKPDGAIVAITSADPRPSAVTSATAVSRARRIGATWRIEGSLDVQARARPWRGCPSLPRTTTKTVCVSVTVSESGNGLDASVSIRSAPTATASVSTAGSNPAAPTLAMMLAWPLRAPTTCATRESEPPRSVTWRTAGLVLLHVTACFPACTVPPGATTSSRTVSASVTLMPADGSPRPEATRSDTGWTWTVDERATDSNPSRSTVAIIVAVPLRLATSRARRCASKLV